MASLRKPTVPSICYLRPARELAADKPHGVRLRYMGGCRCVECRRANSRYESERQRARKAGDWNGIVPAERARSHMLKLARKGVGRRAVQAATDIAETVLFDIRSGRKKRIRARTERLILAVTITEASDHALVSAKSTNMLIRRLLEEGFTKRELARRLGYKNLALQFNEQQITVRNRARVERLYQRLTS